MATDKQLWVPQRQDFSIFDWTDFNYFDLN